MHLFTTGKLRQLPGKQGGRVLVGPRHRRPCCRVAAINPTAAAAPAPLPWRFFVLAVPPFLCLSFPPYESHKMMEEATALLVKWPGSTGSSAAVRALVLLKTFVSSFILSAEFSIPCPFRDV